MPDWQKITTMKWSTHIWSEHDREKRQFLWAGFMQQIDRSIRDLHLSPFYSAVRSNRDELESFLRFTESVDLRERSLFGIDLQTLELIYELDRGVIHERVEEIETFYLPQLDQRFREYTALKQFLYEMITIKSIGIENLYTKEGLLFIRNKANHTVYVYRYYVSNYVNARERSMIKLQLLDQLNDRLGLNLVKYKQDLNDRWPYDLNGYLIESEIKLPHQKSVIPIAKGKLSRYLQTG